MEIKLIEILMAIWIICDQTFASRSTCQPTMADIEGSYYVEGALLRNSSQLCNLTDNLDGTQLIVKGRVTEKDCRTGIRAVLDVWQADAEGDYALEPGDYKCRGKFMTDPKGYYHLDTVLPGWYLQCSGYRPAHVHFKIFRLHDPHESLTTQLYFKQDPYLAENDSCDSFCHSGDPTITVPLKKWKKYNHGNDTSIVQWDIVLRPKQEDKGAKI